MCVFAHEQPSNLRILGTALTAQFFQKEIKFILQGLQAVLEVQHFERNMKLRFDE